MMWRKWASFERAWSRNNIEFIPKEILPSAGWAEDSNSHYLLISLPGFEQDDIKIEVEDDPGRIKISGQRKKKKSSLVGNNITFFNKTYTIPDNNGDIRSASGKLEAGGIFTVTISKKNMSPPPLTTVEEDHQAAADKDDDEYVDKESNTKSPPAYCDDQNTKMKLDQNSSRSGKHSGSVEEDGNDHHGATAAEAINKNKGMIFTLLAAFTLGMLVSRKLESRRRKLPNSLLNT